jgi:uncharacterized protein YodC (DUF2158 family)
MVFQKGNEVQMKSGGPRTVVLSVSSEGTVRCEWMDGATKKSLDFDETSLKLYAPPKAQVFWLGSED